MCWFLEVSELFTLRLTPSKHLLVTLLPLGDNGTIHFWDWHSGYNFQKLQMAVQPGSLQASEAGIFHCTYDMSGCHLLTAEADKTIKIFKEDETAVRGTFVACFCDDCVSLSFYFKIRQRKHIPLCGSWKLFARSDTNCMVLCLFIYICVIMMCLSVCAGIYNAPIRRATPIAKQLCLLAGARSVWW